MALKKDIVLSKGFFSVHVLGDRVRLLLRVPAPQGSPLVSGALPHSDPCQVWVRSRGLWLT